MRWKTILAGLLAIVAQPAWASCEDILRYINYDVNRNYSQLSSEQITNATFCSAEYATASKAKQAGIEASYKLISGAASSTSSVITSKQLEICKGKFEKDYLATLNIMSSEIVSPAAVQAVQACYDADDFKLTRLSSSGESFSADFEWAGAGPLVVNGFEVSTNGGKPVAECKLRYKDKPKVIAAITIQPRDVVTLTCNRSYSDMVLGADERVRVLPEGLVTVASLKGSIAVPLVAVSSPLARQSRIAQLEQQYVATNSRVDALAKVDAATAEQLSDIDKRRYRVSWGGASDGTVSYTNHETSFTCAEGSVAIGVTQNRVISWNSAMQRPDIEIQKTRCRALRVQIEP